jgi:SRSO17 transposase
VHILLSLSILFSGLLFGKSTTLSTIPVPKVQILKKDTSICDEVCLKEYLLDDQIFSFLANIDGSVKNLALREKRLMYEALFNIEAESSNDSIRIALLLPEKVIGRYATTTTNAVLAYLMAKNRRFEVKSFKIDREDNESINSTLQSISKEKFEFIIAPMTVKGAEIIARAEPSINVFFPTIHSSKIANRTSSLYFGGIDYQAQMEKLLQYTPKNSGVALLYDDSLKGQELNQVVEFLITENYKDNRILLNRAIQKDYSDFSPIFEDKENRHNPLARKLKGATFFLNTPIIKSSLILTQLTLYEREPNLILSTQINYKPMLLSMTQNHDRNSMLIANSISTEENNGFIVDANKLLNNDIVYNWINYSTTVGTDYFFHIITGTEREYSEEFIDNQVVYPIRVVKPLENRFKVLPELQLEESE